MYTYKLNKQHLLSEDKLKQSKKRLKEYNFSSHDENNLFVTPDYSGYALNIRFECEIIREGVTEIKEHEKYEEKLLYSNEDLQLLVAYVGYIRELILICNSIVEYVFNSRNIVLKHSMTKQQTIRMALEQQRYLLECHNFLSHEILKIM